MAQEVGMKVCNGQWRYMMDMTHLGHSMVINPVTLIRLSLQTKKRLDYIQAYAPTRSRGKLVSTKTTVNSTFTFGLSSTLNGNMSQEQAIVYRMVTIIQSLDSTHKVVDSMETSLTTVFLRLTQC